MLPEQEAEVFLRFLPSPQRQGIRSQIMQGSHKNGFSPLKRLMSTAKLSLPATQL